jgi:hypothetical protein
VWRSPPIGVGATALAAVQDRAMGFPPAGDRLNLTGDDEADRLLVGEARSLLIGFALDQQVPVHKAFGPKVGGWRDGKSQRRRVKRSFDPADRRV